jgi:hypothetical protein
VKVPKACGERSRTNDKPAGKLRKWMSVYVAVDAHTLDLLHIIQSNQSWFTTFLG